MNPGPMRSDKYVYGLPWSISAQKKVCDKGTAVAMGVMRILFAIAMAGGPISPEHLMVQGPPYALIFPIDVGRKLAVLPGILLRTVDQCMLGALWKKSTGILTNAPS